MWWLEIVIHTKKNTLQLRAVTLFIKRKNTNIQNELGFNHLILFFHIIFQKQSIEGVLYKRCSEKFRKIHRNIPASESLI